MRESLRLQEVLVCLVGAFAVERAEGPGGPPDAGAVADFSVDRQGLFEERKGLGVLIRPGKHVCERQVVGLLRSLGLSAFCTCDLVCLAVVASARAHISQPIRESSGGLEGAQA